MNIKYIIEEFSGDRFDHRDSDIRDALKSENPALRLETIFGNEYYPKIKRWLDNLLKNIKVTEEETNIPGGELKAKLEKYLEIEDTDDQYESNATVLAREILNSYNSWNKKQIKDMNLPAARFEKGEKNVKRKEE